MLKLPRENLRLDGADSARSVVVLSSVIMTLWVLVLLLRVAVFVFGADPT